LASRKLPPAVLQKTTKAVQSDRAGTAAIPEVSTTKRNASDRIAKEQGYMIAQLRLQ
jgi:hypothetical protein